MKVMLLSLEDELIVERGEYIKDLLEDDRQSLPNLSSYRTIN